MDSTLVQVSVEAIRPAPAIGAVGESIYDVTLRGLSSNPYACFTETVRVASKTYENIQLLHKHGSVVVELVGLWQYDHHATGGWINYVFSKVTEQIEALSMTSQDDKPYYGYDAELAQSILVALNKIYPAAMPGPMDLKRALSNAPSDKSLLTALDALLGDGLITGRPLRNHTRAGNSLEILANIQITREGRKHLAPPKEKAPQQSSLVVHGDHITNTGTVGSIGRYSIGTVPTSGPKLKEVLEALDELIAALNPLRQHDGALDRAHRELMKVHDEITDEPEPDQNDVNKWLSRSKQVIATASLGYEVADAAHKLFSLVGL